VEEMDSEIFFMQYEINYGGKKFYCKYPQLRHLPRFVSHKTFK